MSTVTGAGSLSRVVRRGAHGGRSEQEATEGTEMGSILCFLCYLLLSLEAGPFRADDADFFS